MAGSDTLRLAAEGRAHEGIVMNELRQALRSVGRAPRVGVACVLTLALALAAAATLVTLLETFVFPQRAMAAPRDLFAAYPLNSSTATATSGGFSPAMLQVSIDLREDDIRRLMENELALRWAGQTRKRRA